MGLGRGTAGQCGSQPAKVFFFTPTFSSSPRRRILYLTPSLRRWPFVEFFFALDPSAKLSRSLLFAPSWPGGDDDTTTNEPRPTLRRRRHRPLPSSYLFLGASTGPHDGPQTTSTTTSPSICGPQRLAALQSVALSTRRGIVRPLAASLYVGLSPTATIRPPCLCRSPPAAALRHALLPAVPSLSFRAGLPPSLRPRAPSQRIGHASGSVAWPRDATSLLSASARPTSQHAPDELLRTATAPAAARVRRSAIGFPVQSRAACAELAASDRRVRELHVDIFHARRPAPSTRAAPVITVPAASNSTGGVGPSLLAVNACVAPDARLCRLPSLQATTNARTSQTVRCERPEGWDSRITPGALFHT